MDRGDVCPLTKPHSGRAHLASGAGVAPTTATQDSTNCSVPSCTYNLWERTFSQRPTSVTLEKCYYYQYASTHPNGANDAELSALLRNFHTISQTQHKDGPVGVAPTAAPAATTTSPSPTPVAVDPKQQEERNGESAPSEKMEPQIRALSVRAVSEAPHIAPHITTDSIAASAASNYDAVLCRTPVTAPPLIDREASTTPAQPLSIVREEEEDGGQAEGACTHYHDDDQSATKVEHLFIHRFSQMERGGSPSPRSPLPRLALDGRRLPRGRRAPVTEATISAAVAVPAALSKETPPPPVVITTTTAFTATSLNADCESAVMTQEEQHRVAVSEESVKEEEEQEEETRVRKEEDASNEESAVCQPFSGLRPSQAIPHLDISLLQQQQVPETGDDKEEEASSVDRHNETHYPYHRACVREDDGRDSVAVVHSVSRDDCFPPTTTTTTTNASTQSGNSGGGGVAAVTSPRAPLPRPPAAALAGASANKVVSLSPLPPPPSPTLLSLSSLSRPRDDDQHGNRSSLHRETDDTCHWMRSPPQQQLQQQPRKFVSFMRSPTITALDRDGSVSVTYNSTDGNTGGEDSNGDAWRTGASATAGGWRRVHRSCENEESACRPREDSSNGYKYNNNNNNGNGRCTAGLSCGGGGGDDRASPAPCRDCSPEVRFRSESFSIRESCGSCEPRAVSSLVRVDEANYANHNNYNNNNNNNYKGVCSPVVNPLYDHHVNTNSNSINNCSNKNGNVEAETCAHQQGTHTRRRQRERTAEASPSVRLDNDDDNNMGGGRCCCYHDDDENYAMNDNGLNQSPRHTVKRTFRSQSKISPSVPVPARAFFRVEKGEYVLVGGDGDGDDNGADNTINNNDNNSGAGAAQDGKEVDRYSHWSYTRRNSDEASQARAASPASGGLREAEADVNHHRAASPCAPRDTEDAKEDEEGEEEEEEAMHAAPPPPADAARPTVAYSPPPQQEQRGECEEKRDGKQSVQREEEDDANSSEGQVGGAAAAEEEEEEESSSSSDVSRPLGDKETRCDSGKISHDSPAAVSDALPFSTSPVAECSSQGGDGKGNNGSVHQKEEKGNERGQGDAPATADADGHATCNNGANATDGDDDANNSENMTKSSNDGNNINENNSNDTEENNNNNSSGSGREDDAVTRRPRPTLIRQHVATARHEWAQEAGVALEEQRTRLRSRSWRPGHTTTTASSTTITASTSALYYYPPSQLHAERPPQPQPQPQPSPASASAPHRAYSPAFLPACSNGGRTAGAIPSDDDGGSRNHHNHDNLDDDNKDNDNNGNNDEQEDDNTLVANHVVELSPAPRPEDRTQFTIHSSHSNDDNNHNNDNNNKVDESSRGAPHHSNSHTQSGRFRAVAQRRGGYGGGKSVSASVSPPPLPPADSTFAHCSFHTTSTTAADAAGVEERRAERKERENDTEGKNQKGKLRGVAATESLSHSTIPYHLRNNTHSHQHHQQSPCGLEGNESAPGVASHIGFKRPRDAPGNASLSVEDHNNNSNSDNNEKDHRANTKPDKTTEEKISAGHTANNEADHHHHASDGVQDNCVEGITISRHKRPRTESVYDRLHSQTNASSSAASGGGRRLRNRTNSSSNNTSKSNNNNIYNNNSSKATRKNAPNRPAAAVRPPLHPASSSSSSSASSRYPPNTMIPSKNSNNNNKGGRFSFLLPKSVNRFPTNTNTTTTTSSSAVTGEAEASEHQKENDRVTRNNDNRSNNNKESGKALFGSNSSDNTNNNNSNNQNGTRALHNVSPNTNHSHSGLRAKGKTGKSHAALPPGQTQQSTRKKFGTST